MSNSKALTTINFAPTLDVPDNALPLKVDVYNPNLSYEDVLPENYFSMEGLQAWLDARGAESRVLTVTAVSMEILYDPSKGETAKDGEWRPVVWFAETETGLVINKTRGQQLTKMSGPLLAHWAKVGRVAIKPGIGNGKAQIVIGPVPGEEGGKRQATAGRPVGAAEDEVPF